MSEYGRGSQAAFVLVIFVLLVIIIGAGFCTWGC
ncbi:sporulation protein YjcZ [Bacillus sp. V5-8f]|nr:sporulation protein YjcZ [Bacillus sp. V5-8f]PLT33250.1 sporulation protein YjcZ [Bacillus sp. V5-8f]